MMMLPTEPGLDEACQSSVYQTVRTVMESIIDEIEFKELEDRLKWISGCQGNVEENLSSINSDSLTSETHENNQKKVSRTDEKLCFDDHNAAVMCEDCRISFVAFSQWESHRSVFHGIDWISLSPTAVTVQKLNEFTVSYRCTVCKFVFANINAFLSHDTCADLSKKRLSRADYCVCVFCGCGVLRGNLYAHLTSAHYGELSLIDGTTMECRFCRPFVKIGSRIERLCHLMTWHSLAFKMTPSRKSPKLAITSEENPSTKTEMPTVQKDSELCHLCSEMISSQHFASHVINVHCNLESRKSEPLKRKASHESGSNLKVKQPRAKKSFAPRRDRMNNSPTVELQRSCIECKGEFPTSTAVAIHAVEQKCQPKRLVTCGVCGSVFMNWQLFIHLMSHRDILCPSESRNKVLQENLSDLVCGFKEYCERCRAYGTFTHTCKPAGKVNRFRCAFCSKDFLDKWVVETHITLYHNKKETVECYGAFGRKRKMAKAVTQNRPFAFLSKAQRKRRQLLAMKYMNEPSAGELTCFFCNAKFHGKMMRDIHLETFHTQVARQSDSLMQAALRMSSVCTENKDQTWDEQTKRWHVPSEEDMKFFLDIQYSKAQEQRRAARERQLKKLNARNRNEGLLSYPNYSVPTATTIGGECDKQITTDPIPSRFLPVNQILPGYQRSKAIPVKGLTTQQVPPISTGGRQVITKSSCVHRTNPVRLVIKKNTPILRQISTAGSASPASSSATTPGASKLQSGNRITYIRRPAGSERMKITHADSMSISYPPVKKVVVSHGVSPGSIPSSNEVSTAGFYKPRYGTPSTSRYPVNASGAPSAGSKESVRPPIPLSTIRLYRHPSTFTANSVSQARSAAVGGIHKAFPAPNFIAQKSQISANSNKKMLTSSPRSVFISSSHGTRQVKLVSKKPFIPPTTYVPRVPGTAERTPSVIRIRKTIANTNRVTFEAVKQQQEFIQLDDDDVQFIE